MSEAEARRIEDEWYGAPSLTKITRELKEEWHLRCVLRDLVELIRDAIAEHEPLCRCKACVKQYGPVQSNL